MPDATGHSHTDSGLHGVGRIPYGAHLCHFFHKRQDLVDSLGPWFQTGLEKGEHCIWVTSAPFPAEDARAALTATMPSFPQMEKEGRITILDAADWYTEVKGGGAVSRWLKAEEEALARGCTGLRITGNTSFLKSEDWADFIAYEAHLDKSIRSRRIVALCSYSLQKSSASDIFDVTANHRQTLTRSDLKWDLFEP